MLMRSLLTFAMLAIPAPLLFAQEGYKLPPQEVVDIIDAPAAPLILFSPDKAWMLQVERAAMPSIEDVSRRMLRLAGTRIDPVANARYTTNFNSGLVLKSMDGKVERRFAIPEGARLSSVFWSHDEDHFAYIVIDDKGSSLYAGSAAKKADPIRITDQLNTVTGSPRFLPDGRTLLCMINPADRGAEPVQDISPKGPNIQATSGNTSPLRTYQDLLSSAFDEQLFEYYATTQAVIFSSDGRLRKDVGKPQIFASLSPSPDGTLLLATTVHRPMSYLMPWYSFPKRIAVWDLEGKEQELIAELPLAENIPLGGVALGPRSVQWNPHQDAGLLWVEAQDGGDPKMEAEHRDQWFAVSDIRKPEPAKFLATEHRASGLQFLEDSTLVIASEYDRDRRWTRSTLHAVDGSSSLVIEDRSVQDSYGNPGSFVTRWDSRGNSLVRLERGGAFRTGSGASDLGLLPFLDRMELDTAKSTRLWQCALGRYESIVGLLDTASNDTQFITRRESPAEVPNYFACSQANLSGRALTKFEDPTPSLRGITKQLVTYERADGVPLSATLYLPAGYEPGTKLPLLVWAYPREFNDPKTAAQVTTSPWRFTRVSGLSHLVLLTQGYAIMDGATMPVVGDPETMNDTFIEQIVAASKAAIDKAVEMGVSDGKTVFVGGHSYGAFMTANLLAHCDLFTSGVARSGAYNRTLTPFGFQSERRTFWEAPEAYFGVSPFMHADKINEPLLMIHGEIDNNSGTFPLQSERLFQAIKGNGGTARLVMLPNESHGYRARESVLHVHAETIEWFAQFLKSPE